MKDHDIYATQMLETARQLKALADHTEQWCEFYRAMPGGDKLHTEYGHLADVSRVQSAAFRQAVATIWENYQRAEDGIDW